MEILQTILKTNKMNSEHNIRFALEEAITCAELGFNKLSRVWIDIAKLEIAEDNPNAEKITKVMAEIIKLTE